MANSRRHRQPRNLKLAGLEPGEQRMGREMRRRSTVQPRTRTQLYTGRRPHPIPWHHCLGHGPERFTSNASCAEGRTRLTTLSNRSIASPWPLKQDAIALPLVLSAIMLAWDLRFRP
jgi:hypothetical protein